MPLLLSIWAAAKRIVDECTVWIAEHVMRNDLDLMLSAGGSSRLFFSNQVMIVDMGESIFGEQAFALVV